jgi:hypothetical protein
LSDYGQIYESLRTLILCWKVMFAVVLQLNIVSNGLIYLDLYLCLRNPFYPRGSRTYKYYVILFLTLMMSSGTSIYTYSHNTFTLEVYDKIWPLNAQVKWLVLAFLATTVFSIGMVTCRLLKPGTSRALRRKVVCRYILYLVIYLSWHL